MDGSSLPRPQATPGLPFLFLFLRRFRAATGPGKTQPCPAGPWFTAGQGRAGIVRQNSIINAPFHTTPSGIWRIWNLAGIPTSLRGRLVRA